MAWHLIVSHALEGIKADSCQRQRGDMCSFMKWCHVIVGIVLLPTLRVLATTKPSCSGGRSLRGLTEIIDHSPARTISCCDENVCHGGLTLKGDAFSSSFISLVDGDPTSTLERYAQAIEKNKKSNEARHKRYSTTLYNAFFYDFTVL